MKILLINYRYFFSGGPEKYMFTIKELLESHGHTVIPFSVHSKNNVKTEYENYFADPIGGDDQIYYEDYKKNIKTVLQMLDRQFYSFSVKKKLERLIVDTSPDVCYLMHHYNKLSPSVIDACKKFRIPVIMRLSDFFLACPNALFIRDGKVCEECLQKSLFSAVKHRCVKNSMSSSFIKVTAMYTHKLLGIYKKINYIIAPSAFTISKIKLKLPKNKFVQIPTFVNPTEKYNSKIGSYALFVGRTQEEKGVMTLIKAVQGTKHKLKIVGKSSTEYDQKIKDYLRDNNLKNIEFVGPKYGKELHNIYRHARCVIVPSELYDNMPNVVLEGMIFSKPIIASNLGSFKELIAEKQTGLLFEPKNVIELRKKMDLVFKNDKLARKLGKNAYNEAITKYSPEKHYLKLINVFNKAIAEEKSKWKH
jgi:glycosyltransferase involved in cell wall biosynthesis